MAARTRIDLDALADLHNLALAAFLAGRGKRQRPEAAAFFADLEGSLARLGQGIRHATRPLGLYRAFTVRDPKPRLIHAPCFEDRVLHHALFAHAGPVLERASVGTCFACRTGKGPHAAVVHAQSALRRFPW
jgi:RNA-directed DNA polymerase